MMDFNPNQFADACIQAIGEKIKSLNKLNIIVAGKTGVGKSTLINSVFRAQLADTGMGKPVTTHMRRISKPGIPLNIYDTRGFELGRDAQKEVKDEVVKAIKEGLASKDINKAIHCIWYCINTTSNRIEQEEIDWLRDFSAENAVTQVPVIVVLTQAISKKNALAMKNAILDENLDVIQVIPVLAADYEIDEEFTKEAYGLDVLIQVMSAALPDELQHTLQNVQQVAIGEKKRYAQSVVAASAAAAAATGATPIPFADSAILIPTQAAMIASITAIFGLEVNKSLIMGFLSSVIGTGSATIAGKAVVANLIKLIPGAGTVAGGAISGTTAALITTALGEAYILLMEAVYKGELTSQDLNTVKGREKMKQFLKQGLRRHPK